MAAAEMLQTGRTRIVLPERIQRGDVIRVQVVIQHPMDTGFFRDANASIIPAWFIKDVQVHYAGAEIARFEWTSGISRDPMFTFKLRADQEGALTVTSHDNRDSEYSGSATIAFAAT